MQRVFLLRLWRSKIYSKIISNGTFMRFCGVLPCTMIGPHYWCLSERRPTHQLLLSFGKSPQELSYTNFAARFSGVLKNISLSKYLYIYILCVGKMKPNKREYNVYSRIYSMLVAPCHCIQVDKPCTPETTAATSSEWISPPIPGVNDDLSASTRN